MVTTRRPSLSLVAALAFVAPLPQAAEAADFCAEAWVLRNLIMDRLGHCFSSTAGQMLFDNSDCTISGPTPPPRLAEAVGFAREGEAHIGCRIDTSRPPSAAMREVHAHYSRFSDLPVPDYVGGYACWGYRGPDFPVRSGASDSAPVLGTARTGQSVVTTYFTNVPGWGFVDIWTEPDGDLLLSGWITGVDLRPANCDLVAG